MHPQAKASFQGMLAGHNSQDAAAIASQFAPDGLFRVVPVGTEAHGREQIAALLQREFDAFPDWRLERRAMHACGDVVWIEFTITGTQAGEYHGHAATHRAFELHACALFELAPDGLIAAENAYFDEATILRQLGIVETARAAA